MKGLLKKAISYLIIISTVMTLFAPAVSAVNEQYLPIVYVIGKVDVIKKDKDDPNSKTIYPISLEGDMAGGTTEVMKKFLAAYTAEQSGLNTDSLWEDYGNTLYKEVADLYAELKLNENGEPADNSGILWTWKDSYGKSTLTDTKREDGTYGLEDYMFHYDWRLDMFHNAEILDEYIDDVLEATGSSKCVLISRCYGCNVVVTYMTNMMKNPPAYSKNKIADCIFYCSTAVGSVVTGEMFCGNFNLSPDGMQNYLEDLFGVNPISASISKSVLAKAGKYITGFAESINKIYAKISNVMLPKTLINSFASMPGYWSMVNSDYYEKALQFIFGSSGSDMRKTYEGLIGKIDKYHTEIMENCENIQSPFNLFKKMSKNGVRIELIVKYGNQIAPMIEDCDLLGDGIVEVKSASLGATAAKINDTLDLEYVNKRMEEGKIDYISDSYQIDASTGMFPETTWYTEGIDHFDFPESVDELLLAISRANGKMTVDTYYDFPRFKQYEGEGNLATWAGRLYLYNSTDSFPGWIRKIISYVNMIVSGVYEFISLGGIISV